MIPPRVPDRDALVAELTRGLEVATEVSLGLEDRFFSIAGRSIRLRFAGDRLRAPMTLALAHLQVESVERPDLEVCLWDGDFPFAVETLEGTRQDAGARDGIRLHFEGELYAQLRWTPRSIHALDARGGRGYVWIESAADLGISELAMPLLPILQLWLKRSGAQPVHAAAVGTPDGCLLLVGAAGAGKTSTSLACLSSDLRQLGEDVCVVTLGDPPSVGSIYGSAKVDPNTLDRLPGLRELVAPVPQPDGEKELLDIHSTIPEKLLSEAPLHAIAIPRVTSRPDTRAHPSTAGAALAALAPSTLLQFSGVAKDDMPRLRSIVESVPCHHLDVGSDPTLIPPAIEDLLRSP